jgi:hypothetical protein
MGRDNGPQNDYHETIRQQWHSGPVAEIRGDEGDWRRG